MSKKSRLNTSYQRAAYGGIAAGTDLIEWSYEGRYENAT